ncbi:hypothetical protein HPB50_001826 [Hyalomma asiaticum]|uniref:Uncharacterized protein n=1 Tax=Hyalomma asiaticum TaxID=266040 RepID=A0ACB7SJU1_HYAAI|nr:hypothetical protein HPB50_001826 [Hyalomma asiaticum]
MQCDAIRRAAVRSDSRTDGLRAPLVSDENQGEEDGEYHIREDLAVDALKFNGMLRGLFFALRLLADSKVSASDPSLLRIHHCCLITLGADAIPGGGCRGYESNGWSGRSSSVALQ